MITAHRVLQNFYRSVAGSDDIRVVSRYRFTAVFPDTSLNFAVIHVRQTDSDNVSEITFLFYIIFRPYVHS